MSLLLFLFRSFLLLGEWIYKKKGARPGVFDLELRLWLIDGNAIFKVLAQSLRWSVSLIFINDGFLESLIRDIDIVTNKFPLNSLNFNYFIHSTGVLLRYYLHIVSHSHHGLMGYKWSISSFRGFSPHGFRKRSREATKRDNFLWRILIVDSWIQVAFFNTNRGIHCIALSSRAFFSWNIFPLIFFTLRLLVE